MAFDATKCFTIISLEDNNVFTIGESPIDGSHYLFSKTGGDSDWVADTITLNTGEIAYLRGTNYPGAESSSNAAKLSSTGKFNVSGSIMSLVDDGAGAKQKITEDYAFKHFLDGSLVVEVGSGFLSATILSKQCYASLFSTCGELTTIPSGLLPVKELAEACYYSMFSMCPKLTKGPDLPAEKLVKDCYDSMFKMTRNLVELHVEFSEWTDKDGSVVTMGWLQSSGGTFYCPADLDMSTRGDSTVPSSWSIVTHNKPLKGHKGSVMFNATLVSPITIEEDE